MTTDLRKVMETVAAIALHMGQQDEKLRRAYDAAIEQMDGYPGFYRAAIDAAVALEAYGREQKIFWGKDADWILTTEALADGVLDFIAVHRRLPRAEERDGLVAASITKS